MDYQSQNTDQNQQDFNQNSNGYSHSPYYRPNGLSHTAKTLGITAFISSFFGIGFIFASLAIIFAVLSRDKQNRFTDEGRTAVLLAALSFLITIGVIVFALVDPTMHALLNQQFKEMYQITFDEYINRIINGEAIPDSTTGSFLLLCNRFLFF